MDTTATSYSYNFQYGHPYTISVYTVNSCGATGDPATATITQNANLSVTLPSISPVNQISFYVSPSGNDANPGTLASPFKTLVKARNAVRAINKTMTSDIAVYLRGGYYPLDAPLALDANDSGMNGHNIFYLNYQNEIPLISGGKVITGWVQDGNKWKAHVGTAIQTRQLYVNGVRATRARSNGGLAGGQKTATGYITSDASMQNWKNQQDIEVVGYGDWKHFRCPVQSIVGNAITVKNPCWQSSQAQPGYTFNLPAWIENAYELLDTPGEWYLDRSTGWIYYMPRSGEDMNTASVIAPTLETLISGMGTLDTPIHNLVFHGLTFAYATWLGPNLDEGFANVQADYYVTSQTPMYNPLANYTRMPANVTFQRAQNVRFERNNFIHLGAVGLALYDGSQNNIINGNHFTDISASAINVGDTDKPKTTDDWEITKTNQIADNYVHKVAAEYQGSIGIWLGYVQNSSVIHNEIFDLTYDGLSIGWGWGVTDPSVAQNNYVGSNLIYDVAKILTDVGGLYSLSAQPGNIYTANVIHDANHVKGSIYLDNKSRYITATYNVLYNGPGFFFNDNLSPNYVYRNYTNLSGAPAAIVNNAGLEGAFQGIKQLPSLPSPSTPPNTSTPTPTPKHTPTPTPTTKPGDLNGDGKVDIFDYNLLVANFGKTGSPGFIPADIDKNGKVNIFDYNILVGNFGK